MNDNIAVLFVARANLLTQHAQAEARRDHEKMQWLRAALGAVETRIAYLTPPPPVRVARKLREPVPDTVVGDYRPTLYAPEYARTELMEAHQ